MPVANKVKTKVSRPMVFAASMGNLLIRRYPIIANKGICIPTNATNKILSGKRLLRSGRRDKKVYVRTVIYLAVGILS